MTDRKFIELVKSFEDFENVKGRLFVRPVPVCEQENFKGNKGKYATFNIHDMMFRLAILVEEDYEGCTSAAVTKGMLKTWGVKLPEALTQAIENTEYTMKPIEYYLYPGIEFDEDELTGMYVCHTKNGVNGAGCLADNKFMMEIAEKLGDYYIFPSSVHEIIVLSKENEDELGKEELAGMIAIANEDVVDEKDKLSNTLYMYSEKEKRIVIA